MRQILQEDLISNLIFIDILEIKVLKEIIENVPEDYEIYFTGGKNVFSLSDKFEIDVSQKKIIFQKY